MSFTLGKNETELFQDDARHVVERHCLDRTSVRLGAAAQPHETNGQLAKVFGRVAIQADGYFAQFQRIAVSALYRRHARQQVMGPPVGPRHAKDTPCIVVSALQIP